MTCSGGGVSVVPGECGSVTVSLAAVRSILTSCSEPEPTLSPRPAALWVESDKVQDEMKSHNLPFYSFYNPNVTLSLYPCTFK